MKTSIFSFTFSGTINRMQYLGAIALQIVAMWVAVMVIVVADEAGSNAAMIIALIIALPTLVWAWSIATRRMRDTGANPWWVVTGLIPYVSMITGVILLFVPAGSFGRTQA